MPGSNGYLPDLNKEQKEAVLSHLGPVLVLAGAGSGKTRVLTIRIAHLILTHKIHPESILAVTFTNKACNEMRERLSSLLGDTAEILWVATFHSACLRILRRHARLLNYKDGFVVYDDNDSTKVLKEVLNELNLNDPKYPPSFFSHQIDNAKNSFIGPDNFSSKYNGKDNLRVSEVYEHYQRALYTANAMDFGDLLFNAARLFKEHPEILDLYQADLKFILVDEFQDTNYVQYRLLKMLTKKQKSLFVVGDDDQAIYGFRGATSKFILNFDKDFPGTEIIRLEQNYRSTGNIIAVSNSVISNNKERRDKTLWTSSADGEPVNFHLASDADDEASFVVGEIEKKSKEDAKFKETAIFYRTNAQSRAIEEALVKARIPYRIYGSVKFYERKEIKDMISYIRILVNPSDNQAFLRIINTPARGIGPSTVQKLKNLAALEATSLYDATEKATQKSQIRNKGIQDFIYIVEELRQLTSSYSLSSLMEAILDKTGYRASLEALETQEAQDRLDNIRELIAIAVSMENNHEDKIEVLMEFLDRASLTSSGDMPSGPDDNTREDLGSVSLMTLHLAKGLEFDLVFFTGFEEGLVPHARSMISNDDLEEERRLCYVGLTRAKKYLYITAASSRMSYSAGGSYGVGGRYRMLSRFYREMPLERISRLRRDLNESDELISECANDPVVEYEPEPLEYSSFKRKKVEKDRSKAIPNLVAADNLVNDGLILAKTEDLKEGVKVVHPHFGIGVVQSLETDPINSKVVINFESTESPKKLFMEYTKLFLASN